MGRPSTPLLSPALIAETALDLVDRTGGFTIAEVAAALGVRPSSLYNHLRGRDEIVEAVRALVFAAVPRVRVGDGEEWRPALRALLRAYRDAFARHPRLIPTLTAHTVSAGDVMRIYDDLAGVLLSAGVREERLLDAITVLDSFVIGSALDLVAPDAVWDAARAASPGLARAIAAAPTGRDRADRAFGLGVDLLLHGVAGLAADR